MITPLLSAISVKNNNISKILINNKMNLNDTKDIKLTPLHYASYYGLVKITELLLNQLVNDKIKTKKEGVTTLYLACKKGNFEIAKILLNKNGNIINSAKLDNKTSLHFLVINSSITKKILLTNKAATYIKDNHNNTTSKLSLIYDREDIFNMIDSNNNEENKFYNIINKYNNYNCNWKTWSTVKIYVNSWKKMILKLQMKSLN